MWLGLKGAQDGSQDVDFRKFLFSYINPLYIGIYLSAAPNPALVPASHYSRNAARPYLNKSTNVDSDGRMEARTSNFENFYCLLEIHCTSMYLCLLPQIQLLCQQVATISMQLNHIAIYILNLIRIERGLGWQPGPRTSKMSFFL